MRSVILHSALAVLAVAAFGAPAHAAKEPAAGKHDHPAGGVGPEVFIKDGDTYRPASEAEVRSAAANTHEAGGGLEFTGLKRYDLGIYTLVVFGLLLLVLSKYAWPHISEGLQKREAAIIGARDEAIKARTEAEETRAKLQKDYAEAQDKIRAMLDEARRDADALKATEKEAGVKEAAAERDRAKRETAAEREALRQELHEYTVQLAATLSAKTIRRELTADDHRRLLADSLAELKNGVGKA